jgi:hypothetical protein
MQDGEDLRPWEALCVTESWGEHIKASIVSPNSMPPRLARIFSATFLDDGVRNLCSTKWCNSLIERTVVKPGKLHWIWGEEGGGKSRFRLVMSQKSTGGSTTFPAPPIVAKRARTAAKLWVFGWPRFSQRNWRTGNPTSALSAKWHKITRNHGPLQLRLELAAHRFLLVLNCCNTLYRPLQRLGVERSVEKNGAHRDKVPPSPLPGGKPTLVRTFSLAGPRIPPSSQYSSSGGGGR